MIGFVEYLISKGYKPYRKVMSKKGSTYVEDSNIDSILLCQNTLTFVLLRTVEQEK